MNQDEYKAFWRFVNRRQRAWYRKERLNLEWPWSKDDIINRAHFTNVYRELDPGTEYVQAMADGDNVEGFDQSDLAFWILFYRYTGSNRHVMQHIDMVPTEKYRAGKVERVWMQERNPFGNAYLVYPMTNEQTGFSKARLVSEGFADIAAHWQQHWPNIQSADGPEATYKMIRWSRKGIGPFSAYQTWVDYCMLGIIHDWRDIWVMPGPGAKRGASIIWGEPMNEKATAGACLYLHSQAEKYIDIGERYWLDHMPYVSDIQNMLCEYQKYVRVRDTGRVTRRYVA